MPKYGKTVWFLPVKRGCNPRPPKKIGTRPFLGASTSGPANNFRMKKRKKRRRVKEKIVLLLNQKEKKTEDVIEKNNRAKCT